MDEKREKINVELEKESEGSFEIDDIIWECLSEMCDSEIDEILILMEKIKSRPCYTAVIYSRMPSAYKALLLSEK